jgi:hypothetical protein
MPCATLHRRLTLQVGPQMVRILWEQLHLTVTARSKDMSRAIATRYVDLKW